MALAGAWTMIAAGLAVVWLASLVRKDASLVDRVWGLAFVALAWWYLWVRQEPALMESRLLVALATIWGVRLSVHLTRRNWGKGEDYRYAAMRAAHPRFALRSLFTVFLLQATIAWIVGLPLYAGAHQGHTAQPLLVWLGAGIWLVGMVFEVGGDAQLARHRADPTRRHLVLDQGFWRYTRHPNYFGDAMVWWGLWLIATAMGGAWTILGPVLMTWLLVRVSGVGLLERRLMETRPGYRDYVRRTSAFFPRPPRR